MQIPLLDSSDTPGGRLERRRSSPDVTPSNRPKLSAKLRHTIAFPGEDLYERMRSDSLFTQVNKVYARRISFDEVAGPLQTNFEAMVNLLNNCLGSGMLGIAYSISKTGIVVGLVCMVFSALLNKFTLLLHLESCKLTDADPSTSDIAEKTYGDKGKLFMLIAYLFFGFFCMVSMVAGSADAVEGFLKMVIEPEQMPTDSVRILASWVVMLVPPTLIRSLKNVALLSFVAFSGGIILVIAVISQCTKDLATQGLPSFDKVLLAPADFSSFFRVFPVLLLIFSIQAGGGVVIATMEDRSDENVKKVNNRSYIITFALDAVIGISAYLTFLDKTQGDIIKNLPASSIFAVIARLGLLTLLVLSYMIMCIPCKLAVIELLFHKNEAKMESSLLQFYGVTLGINFAALAMALSVSDLALILGLNGSVITNTVAFLMPSAFYLKARANPADPIKNEPVPIFSRPNIPYHLIFAFGIVSLCLGSYQVLKVFVEGQ